MVIFFGYLVVAKFPRYVTSLANMVSSCSHANKGGSTALGRLRIRISELAHARGVCCLLSTRRGAHVIAGDYVPPAVPHFLWVTEFPLFTQADPDKEFLAQGRWSSTHHPFTAPMWQDIEAMYAGRIDQVCVSSIRVNPVLLA